MTYIIALLCWLLLGSIGMCFEAQIENTRGKRLAVASYIGHALLGPIALIGSFGEYIAFKGSTSEKIERAKRRRELLDQKVECQKAKTWKEKERIRNQNDINELIEEELMPTTIKDKVKQKELAEKIDLEYLEEEDKNTDSNEHNIGTIIREIEEAEKYTY